MSLHPSGPDLTPENGRPRSRRWPLAALVLGLALLVLYVATYYRLSRRGLREAAAYNMPGFLYVPLEEVERDRDLVRHYRLATLYAPLNWLDRTLLGVKGPIRGVTWGLSR